jgi:multicomponent Na+:H+ antiporter subunit G
MSELITEICMLVGAGFLLLAAVGAARMPDTYSRLSAATKAVTLGGMLIFVAAAVYFHSPGPTSRSIAGIVFFFVTSPVAAHMIGRAAYMVGAPLWEGTITDELRDKYDMERHILHSHPRAASEQESLPPVEPG